MAALVGATALLTGCSGHSASAGLLKKFASNRLFVESPADAVVVESYTAGKSSDFPFGHGNIGGYSQKVYLSPKNVEAAADELLVATIAASGRIERIGCRGAGSIVDIAAVVDFNGSLRHVALYVRSDDIATELAIVRGRPSPPSESVMALLRSRVFIAASVDGKDSKIPSVLHIACDPVRFSDARVRALTGFGGPIERMSPS